MWFETPEALSSNGRDLVTFPPPLRARAAADGASTSPTWFSSTAAYLLQRDGGTIACEHMEAAGGKRKEALGRRCMFCEGCVQHGASAITQLCLQGCRRTWPRRPGPGGSHSASPPCVAATLRGPSRAGKLTPSGRSARESLFGPSEGRFRSSDGPVHAISATACGHFRDFLRDPRG